MYFGRRRFVLRLNLFCSSLGIRLRGEHKYILQKTYICPQSILWNLPAHVCGSVYITSCGIWMFSNKILHNICICIYIIIFASIQCFRCRDGCVWMCVCMCERVSVLEQQVWSDCWSSHIFSDTTESGWVGVKVSTCRHFSTDSCRNRKIPFNYYLHASTQYDVWQTSAISTDPMVELFVFCFGCSFFIDNGNR